MRLRGGGQQWINYGPQLIVNLRINHQLDPPALENMPLGYKILFEKIFACVSVIGKPVGFRRFRLISPDNREELGFERGFLALIKQTLILSPLSEHLRGIYIKFM